MGAKMSKARGFAPRPYQRQSLWNPFIKWFPKASGLWRVEGRALALLVIFAGWYKARRTVGNADGEGWT